MFPLSYVFFYVIFYSFGLLCAMLYDISIELLLGPRSAPVGVTGSAAQGMATNPQV